MSEPLHQIYCTHCTYQTAFLEQRGGDMADRPLGYAARASSMPAEHLRRQYRNIERLLSYKLPSDATPESRTEHDAHTAPQRFFYHPSLSGNQIVGTICYRTWDAANKSAGAYFAHLVLQKNTDPWDPLEVLKRWNSPTWVREDDRDHPHDLAELKNLQEIEKSMHPLLNDEGFHDFLTQADLSSPDSSSIPERWRKMPLEKRQQYFTLALRGYLQSLGGRRPGILLVAEPEIAVVFFYGILRLLPRGMLKELSFSTYETALADRFIHLAATTLIDPANDIPPDIYKRGCVINTFSGESSFVKKAGDDYTALILEKLVVSLQAADPIIKEMATLNVSTPETLNQLADADRKVQALISDNASELPAQPARNNQQKKYIAARLRKKLQLLAKKKTWENDADRLLQILDYVATQGPGTRNIKAPPTEKERHIDKLLKAIPDAQLAQFIHSNEIDADYKISVLENYVQRLHHLPRECEKYLWQDLSNSSLLHDLLQRLPTQEWINLWGHYAPTADIRFLQLLLEISKLTSSSHETTLQEQYARAYFLSNIIRQQKDEHLITLLKQPAKLKALHSIIGGALTERINALIEDVKSSSNKNTAEKIRIIRQCDFLLDARGKAFAARLQKISKTFNDIKDKTGANRKLFKKPKISEELKLARIHHELAKHLQEALTPLKKHNTEKLITARQCIHLLQATLEVDGGDFGIIDKGFAQDLKSFLDTDAWPQTLRLTRLGSRRSLRPKKKKLLLLSLFSAAGIGIAFVIAVSYFSASSVKSKSGPNKPAANNGSTEEALDKILEITQPGSEQRNDPDKGDSVATDATADPQPNAEVTSETSETTDSHQISGQKTIKVEPEPNPPPTTPLEGELASQTFPEDTQSSTEIAEAQIPLDPVTIIAQLSKPLKEKKVRWAVNGEVSRIQIPNWSIDAYPRDPQTDPGCIWEPAEPGTKGHLLDQQGKQIAYIDYDPKDPATVTLHKELDAFFDSRLLSIVTFDGEKPTAVLTYLPSKFMIGSDKEDGTKNTPQKKHFNENDEAIFELPFGTPPTITATISDKFSKDFAHLIIAKDSKSETFPFPLEEIKNDLININIDLQGKYEDLGIKSASVAFTHSDETTLTAALYFVPSIKKALEQVDLSKTRTIETLSNDCNKAVAKLNKDLIDPVSSAYKIKKSKEDENWKELANLLEVEPKEKPDPKDSNETANWKKWCKELREMAKKKTRLKFIEKEFDKEKEKVRVDFTKKKDHIHQRRQLKNSIQLPNLYGIKKWEQQNTTIYIPLITDGKEPKSIPQSHAADGSIDDESSKELPATENPHKEHQEKGGNEHPTVNETGDSSKDSLEPSDPHTDS